MEMRGATRKLSKWVTSRAHPKREPAGFALCLGSRQDLSLSGNGAIGPVPHLPSPQRYGANLNRALIAGTAYFLALFALGFALGAIRVTFIAPRFGQLAATCVMPRLQTDFVPWHSHSLPFIRISAHIVDRINRTGLLKFKIDLSDV